MSRSALSTLLLIAFLLQLVHSLALESSASVSPLVGPRTIDCGSACNVRCSKSWRAKMCKKMCNICCGRCNCVPPGTSVQERATCPCYANMKNPKGYYKCP